MSTPRPMPGIGCGYGGVWRAGRRQGRERAGGNRLLGRGLRLGRIFGVPIRLDLSWFIGLAIFTTLSHDVWSPLVTGLAAVALSLLFTCAFFTSVLAHELSHALAARVLGIGTMEISLLVFGGVARIVSEPADAAGEALMAMAGPLTSVSLAGLLWLASQLVAGWPGDLIALLGLANLVLAAFNLLPGFPLDGGRVARAVVWRLTGRRPLATPSTSAATSSPPAPRPERCAPSAGPASTCWAPGPGGARSPWSRWAGEAARARRAGAAAGRQGPAVPRHPAGGGDLPHPPWAARPRRADRPRRGRCGRHRPRPAPAGAAADAGRLGAEDAPRRPGDLPQDARADGHDRRRAARYDRARGGGRLRGPVGRVVAGTGARRAAGLVRDPPGVRRAGPPQRGGVVRQAARVLGPARGRRGGRHRRGRHGGPRPARPAGAMAGGAGRGGRARPGRGAGGVRGHGATGDAHGRGARGQQAFRSYRDHGGDHAPLARRWPRGPPRAPHGRPHRLPGLGPPRLQPLGTPGPRPLTPPRPTSRCRRLP